MNPPTCLSCRHFADNAIVCFEDFVGGAKLINQSFLCRRNHQLPCFNYPSLESWIRTAESCPSYEVPPASLG